MAAQQIGAFQAMEKAMPQTNEPHEVKTFYTLQYFHQGDTILIDRRQLAQHLQGRLGFLQKREIAVDAGMHQSIVNMHYRHALTAEFEPHDHIFIAITPNGLVKRDAPNYITWY